MNGVCIIWCCRHSCGTFVNAESDNTRELLLEAYTPSAAAVNPSAAAGGLSPKLSSAQRRKCPHHSAQRRHAQDVVEAYAPMTGGEKLVKAGRCTRPEDAHSCPPSQGRKKLIEHLSRAKWCWRNTNLCRATTTSKWSYLSLKGWCPTFLAHSQSKVDDFCRLVRPLCHHFQYWHYCPIE